MHADSNVLIGTDNADKACDGNDDVTHETNSPRQNISAMKNKKLTNPFKTPGTKALVAKKTSESDSSSILHVTTSKKRAAQANEIHRSTSNDKNSKRHKEVSNAPKRPLNAFMLFGNSIRSGKFLLSYDALRS